MTVLDAAVAEGRAAVEAILTDTCRITKAGPDSEKVWDEASMKYTPAPRVVVYEGPCRIQIKADINSNVVEATSGEREWTYQTASLVLRVVGTEAVRTDMVAEILTAKYDVDLVGRHFNLEGIYRKSQATSRRYRVKEVTG